MQSLLSKITATLIASIACTTIAHATPINYNFSISGFTAPFNYYETVTPPQNTVNGSVTLDEGSVLAFAMNIDGHSYSVADVGVSYVTPTYMSFGALAGGINTLPYGTDDFFIALDLGFNQVQMLGYTTASSYDYFIANFGTLTQAAADVPEPGSLSLLGAAGLAGLALRRRRRK